MSKPSRNKGKGRKKGPGIKASITRGVNQAGTKQKKQISHAVKKGDPNTVEYNNQLQKKTFRGLLMTGGGGSLADVARSAKIRQEEHQNKTQLISKFARGPSTGMLKGETSLKAYYKEFKKVIDVSDVIIEVLDARDPLGCRCIDVEEQIKKSGPSKKIILLLNKIDLVPKENVEKWLNYLRTEYPTVAFKSSTQSQNTKLSRMNVPVKHCKEELLHTTNQCVGANALMKLLSNYQQFNGTKTSIMVGVVGYPNVGKSSLINSLKRERACGVGATPGFTKCSKEVTITKDLKLFDSPGIVMATGSNEAAVVLRNCVKVEMLDDPMKPVEALLKRCDQRQLMDKYDIGFFEDVQEFCTILAKKFGKINRGGVPDLNEAAKRVLNDWNSGKIAYYTHPPERKNAHVKASIVNKISHGFDWDLLEKGNLDTLNSVTALAADQPMAAASDSFMAGSSMMDKDMEMEAEVVGEEEQYGKICVNMVDPRKKKNSYVEPVKTLQINFEDPMSELVASGANVSVNQSKKAIMKEKKKQLKRKARLARSLNIGGVSLGEEGVPAPTKYGPPKDPNDIFC